MSLSPELYAPMLNELQVGEYSLGAPFVDGAVAVQFFEEYDKTRLNVSIISTLDGLIKIRREDGEKFQIHYYGAPLNRANRGIVQRQVLAEPVAELIFRRHTDENKQSIWIREPSEDVRVIDVEGMEEFANDIALYGADKQRQRLQANQVALEQAWPTFYS